MLNDVKKLCDYANLCGECPLWDHERKRLLWTDSDSKELFEYNDIDKVGRIISKDVQVSSMVLSRNGLVLLGHGVWLWDEKGAKKQVIKSFNDEFLNFNDSIAGPDGCIYAGTYYWAEGRMSKHGKLYRIKPDYSIETVDDGIELSNGMAFSPDNRLFYYADSGKRSIYVYDFDIKTGDISNKRVFVKSKTGIPDGITSDREGHIWCAMWYDGMVYRYDPDGRVERVIHFPAKQVSSVTFGGENLDILFITSAKSLFISNLLPKNFDKNDKMGGSLYYIRTQITGKIENRVDF